MSFHSVLCTENDKEQTKTKTTSKTKIMLQVQQSFQLEKSESEVNFSVENYNMDVSYCLCGQPYDPNIFMIQCDACKDWFHSSCTNFQEYTAIEIDKYHCPRCVPTFGPSINKPIRNWHRHNFWESDTQNKPVQTGTAMFITELCARHFASDADVVLHLNDQQLTENFLKSHGFSNPIVIDNKEGLDMKIPPEHFSLYDVVTYVGGDKEIDVIDVGRQSNIKMKLGEYVNYFNSLNRTRVFNVVSLEFSNTCLSQLVEAPQVTRKLDWVNNYWPPECPGKPQVQKYCLLSVKDSYTDFHVDFGGTSVWYHVLRGEKVFYLIKPTPANLTLYSQWMTSTNQSETFFGDQVDQCVRCVLRQGQTMFIPTGWIHAVYTTVDSIVFGGNFLNSLNISMQLSVYEIEKKIKTEQKFLYPNFEMINWFAAVHLLEELQVINTQGRQCPDYLLFGMKALHQALKHWNNEKYYNMAVREQIPVMINVSKLLKDIGREIRHAERYINHLNPPKPERESQRKRKKPVNKDFVDYSLSPKSIAQEIMPLHELPPSTPEHYSPKQPLKLTLPKLAMYPYDRPGSRTQYNQVSSTSSSTDEWLPLFDRPQETVAIHSGGTILKFRLGTKDLNSAIVQNDKLPIHTYGSSFEQDSRDVYDFHDSDMEEDCLKLIDVAQGDSPPPKKEKKAGIKMRLPVKQPKKRARDMEQSNGIESLIHASALAVPGPAQGGTSPSMQEAIAGMLSISQNWPPKLKKNMSLLEEDVNNVHQDEDYIYPSLDNSDDEEMPVFKPRGKSKIDEPWNPKARVGPLLPKMNRPAREGTKKQSVEKVLEAAAARRVNKTAEKAPKRQYRRKKVKPKLDARTTLLPASASSLPSTSIQTAPTITSTATPKPKKGMKTVKQRLGKILKIHKMIH